MNLAFCMFVLFVIAAPVCGQYETVRLLTMGDSTDRCNLQDFCAKHRGHHCSNDTCTISTVRPEPLIGSYLNIQPVSMHTWAIEFCEISRPKIIIAFLFERTGVQPYCPWHLPQPGSEAFCANHSKPNLKPITMRDTFPALYGPIVHRLISAMGGTPHAVTLQSHLWDVTFMFHWSRNQHVCANRQLRKPFVTAWAKNASDYILAVKEMLPEVPFIVWRTGNERNTPSNERCKNDLMDDMNDATVNFEAELKVHRIQYAGKNPPCRDSIHPAPEVTLKYMDKLMASIAANVPEVVGTLKQFSSNDYAKGRSRQ